VTARNDYSVGMNVRGGEADQNLVLLDGYPIYNPFHMGGLFGAFVEPMVDRVDFMTGGFPAAYGGRLSSVLDVHSAVEPRAGTHGRADVSMIATTVALGGGTQEGGVRGPSRRVAPMRIRSPISTRRDRCHITFATRRRTSRACCRREQLSFTAYDNIDHLLQSSVEDGTFDLAGGTGCSVLRCRARSTWRRVCWAFHSEDSVRVELSTLSKRFMCTSKRDRDSRWLEHARCLRVECPADAAPGRTCATA